MVLFYCCCLRRIWLWFLFGGGGVLGVSFLPIHAFSLESLYATSQYFWIIQFTQLPNFYIGCSSAFLFSTKNLLYTNDIYMSFPVLGDENSVLFCWLRPQGCRGQPQRLCKCFTNLNLVNFQLLEIHHVQLYEHDSLFVLNNDKLKFE